MTLSISWVKIGNSVHFPGSIGNTFLDDLKIQDAKINKNGHKFYSYLFSDQTYIILIP